jgi:hypothetical protein
MDKVQDWKGVPLSLRNERGEWALGMARTDSVHHVTLGH